MRINKIGRVYGIKPKGTRAGRTKIMLPAFIYEMESKNFSRDFSNYVVPDGLIDNVKVYLKENHPQEVRRSFGDFEERARLSNLISNYISSRDILESYKHSLGNLTFRELVNILVENIAGFGAIDELFKIPTLTDIHVNSPYDIWIDDYIHGPQKTNIQFKDTKEYNEFIAKILSASNESYSLAKPQASGSLPRLRYDIIGFDLAEYPTVSLRVISKDLRISERSFIESGQGDGKMLTFLKEFMKGSLSVLVSGSTGAGKTELMRFIAGFIPNTKRIVTLEDTKELYLEHLYPNNNIVSWNTRHDFMDESKSINLSRLVIFSLRHHPDWLIVGESRGSELYHLVEASQTGHNVLTGIHSHEGEAVKRMVTILQDYRQSDEDLYGKKIVENIPINIHVERIQGIRRISKIIEYTEFENGSVFENVLFRFNRSTGKHEQVNRLSKSTWDKLIRTGIVNKEKIAYIMPLEQLEKVVNG